MIYKHVIKPILFCIEPELVHDAVTWGGEQLGKLWLAKRMVGGLFSYQHPSLESTVCGIEFQNPVGLAGGFDKDMRLTEIIPEVGFGFMEVGSVTYHPYEGNPGRRLLRLPRDQSIIVYYGLKSIGAKAVHQRIQMFSASRKWPPVIPAGINIAKTNRADIKGEKSVEDYMKTYRLLSPYFAYTTLNVSCPNAQDGCMFQNPALLDTLLGALSREKKHTPIFLKISNSLTYREIDEILKVVGGYSFIDGFVISNLSKNRDALSLHSPKEQLDLLPDGGISGRPIRDISTALISYIYRASGRRYTLIGLGGIFSAEDAYEKIKAGASLVQLVTGLIYEGPEVVKKINHGLVELLRRDDYTNIQQAVGAACRRGGSH